MCSKQNRRFKSKTVQHDYGNKWIKNITKAYVMRIKCKFDGRKCNSNPCSCKNGKYLASIIDDSVITCDESVDAEIKTIPTNFNQKNNPCKTQNFYILFAFY